MQNVCCLGYWCSCFVMGAQYLELGCWRFLVQTLFPLGWEGVWISVCCCFNLSGCWPDEWDLGFSLQGTWCSNGVQEAVFTQPVLCGASDHRSRHSVDLEGPHSQSPEVSGRSLGWVEFWWSLRPLSGKERWQEGWAGSQVAGVGGIGDGSLGSLLRKEGQQEGLTSLCLIWIETCF